MSILSQIKGKHIPAQIYISVHKKQAILFGLPAEKILFVDWFHCRDPFCGSFILDQAGVNTIKFSIFQLSPILHIFALL